MYKNYKHKVDYIKNEFVKYYVDKGPENGILQGTKYAGAATHCRNCLYTLTKMVEPKNVLEIGSWHYESSDAIARAMDELYGKDGYGIVDSFDIKYGGYDGMTHIKPSSKRVNPRYWYAHNSDYDLWKYNDQGIVFQEFKNLSNDEITKKNIDILKDVSKSFNNVYDMLFIDGDHSFEGAKRDFEICLNFCNEDSLIVIDNVWDIRLQGVRQFYDQLDYIKWDFEEWNDEHFQKNMVMDTAIIIPKNG